MEDGEETPIAAMREAWEEAGVQGHITRYLGLFEVSYFDFSVIISLSLSIYLSREEIGNQTLD